MGYESIVDVCYNVCRVSENFFLEHSLLSQLQERSDAFWNQKNDNMFGWIVNENPKSGVNCRLPSLECKKVGMRDTLTVNLIDESHPTSKYRK